MLTASVLLYTGVAGAAPQQEEVISNSDAAGIAEAVITSAPICAVDPGIQRFVRFQTLVSEWRRERGARSSAVQMAMLPSYQKIIAIGPEAIPLILAQLKSEGDAPDHWFWALSVLAPDDNPVPESSRGRLAEMARAWLEWGQKQGHVQMD